MDGRPPAAAGARRRGGCGWLVPARPKPGRGGPAEPKPDRDHQRERQFDGFKVDDAGNITETLSITFSRFSHARVKPVTAGNGLRHWRTLDGGLAGYSYVAGQSGAFQIRKLYRTPDGREQAIVIPPDQT